MINPKSVFEEFHYQNTHSALKTTTYLLQKKQYDIYSMYVHMYIKTCIYNLYVSPGFVQSMFL